MPKAEPRQGILVGLDEVLDTRLGTLARMGEEVAEAVLTSGRYHSRDMDTFQFVDQKHFESLYAQRDSTTLSLSMCTGVVPELKRLTAMLSEQALDRPYHSGAKVFLNLYPYSDSLTVEERDDIYRALVVWLEGTSAEVELLSCSPESLTPDVVVANNIAAMFMYHHDQWMNAQAQAFERTRISDVTLFGPALFSIKPTDAELAQVIKESMHPTHALETLASPLVNLQLKPAALFSLITTRRVTGTSAHLAPGAAQAVQGRAG